MTSAENNAEDWREIRSRIDSFASAIFLISGGALSLSISVLLGSKASGLITPAVASLATTSWYFLLLSVFLFLLLKGHLIIQANLLQFKPGFVDKNLKVLNGIGWAVGSSGFAAFCAGMAIMVRAAAVAIRV
jgi:hypothetical protein